MHRPAKAPPPTAAPARSRRPYWAALAGLAAAAALAAICATSPERARATPAPAWAEALRERIARIERDTPGELGVYVKRLDNGETFGHRAGQPWYLASSAKLAVAITVLQDVAQGRLRPDQPLTLQESDKVDGSGAVVWQADGTRHSVQDLLQRMLMESDNTAANMLIRTVGADRLNRNAQALLGPGTGHLIDFAEVRRAVYSEFTPRARALSNTDLVRVAGAPMGPRRVQALARALGVDADTFQVRTMDEAYERYYRQQFNTATLAGYGGMLERLVRGELVPPPQLQALYQALKFDTYDAYRLEAGLPRSVRFIHKTGTQLHRACHMGVIDPQDGGRHTIVVAACAQGLDEQKEAGRAFEAVGRAITQTVLADRGNHPG